MRRIPTVATLAAVAVGIGTFLSWGYAALPVSPEDQRVYGLDPKPQFVDASGWNSLTEFRGIPVPNFLPFIVALALAIWTWFDRKAGRSGLAAVLITYGTIHSLFASFQGVALLGKGAVGLGAVVSFCAFLALIISFAKADPDPVSEVAWTPTDSSPSEPK